MSKSRVSLTPIDGRWARQSDRIGSRGTAITHSRWWDSDLRTQPSDAPSARRSPSKIRGPRRPATLLVFSLGRFMNSRVRSGAIFVKAATYFAAFGLSPIAVEMDARHARTGGVAGGAA